MIEAGARDIPILDYLKMKFVRNFVAERVKKRNRGKA